MSEPTTRCRACIEGGLTSAGDCTDPTHQAVAALTATGTLAPEGLAAYDLAVTQAENKRLRDALMGIAVLPAIAPLDLAIRRALNALDPPKEGI